MAHELCPVGVVTGYVHHRLEWSHRDIRRYKHRQTHRHSMSPLLWNLHSSQVRQYNINKPTEKIIIDGGQGYEDIKEDNGRENSGENYLRLLRK